MQVLSVTAVTSTASAGERTALLLVCSVLVLLMAVGAVLYTQRLSRAALKVVFASAGLVVVLWALGVYGLVFGSAIIPGFLGNPLGFFWTTDLEGTANTGYGQFVPFAVFQGSVAVLTITIFTTIVAQGLRLKPWLIFAGGWLLLAYAPIAYSVFNTRDGWLFNVLGIVDQAGATVVHISAGVTVFAVLVMVRKSAWPGAIEPGRTGYIGVILIWFGAFGLNVGSEGVVDGLFGTIMLNTLLAPMVAAVAWAVVEMLMYGKPTVRGARSGAVAGVVAITPACGILTPLWAVVLAVLVGATCAALVAVWRRSADRWALTIATLYTAGGFIGLAYIGLFGNGVGWKDSGQPTALADQAGVALAVALYSFGVACVLAWTLQKTIGLNRHPDYPTEPEAAARRIS